MATLVFTAIGTAIGGPLGGALGALVGNQIDNAVLGGPRREGPRLKELAITTSSYGSALPRHFGTVRAPGTIIWATELAETSERGGGGKGRPSTTSYSYAASFAVALASRPIRRLGRIWADGMLLRGAAGDLKTGGKLRVYLGHGDQMPDPLIASAQHGACPAFRGLAYCVLESLQLADFGNRIPALTFEIVADDGAVSLADLIAPIPDVEVTRALPGLTGFSDEGGPLAVALATIDEVYPIACDAGGARLAIHAGDALPANAPMLPEAAVDSGKEGFGGAAGRTARRQPDARTIPAGLRYYDTAREYQAGLQRADGRARSGHARMIEFPGALDATSARALANAAAERTGWARETLAWRVAELDPAIGPGAIVRVPDRGGLWRVESWEWRERGVELELSRLPRGPARQTPADAGQALPAADLVATPTRLVAYELPWDGAGTGQARQVYAAATSEAAGWTGAALYAVQVDGLVPLGGTDARRSRIGRTVAPVPPSGAMLFDRSSIDVELLDTDFLLPGTSVEALARGANHALLGSEVLQFVEAVPLGGPLCRLRGLLRGRGGTEAAARAGHATGTAFVLLDDAPVALDPSLLPVSANTIAAIGLADVEAVRAPIVNPGLTLRPLTPVHARVRETAEGGLLLQWTRRARGAWSWSDTVEAPLNEQAEHYLVGLGDTANPVVRWDLAQPMLALPASTRAQLLTAYPGQPLWVRQIGSFAASDPLLLAHVS